MEALRNSYSLKTDLYQLTMLAGHFHTGSADKIVTCEAFARKLPPSRRFMVMAGTEEIRNILLNFRFNSEDLDFIKNIPALSDVVDSNFYNWLRDFRFTGDMWAMAEGEIIFPGEPLVRITAPIPQTQIAETVILSILNHDVKIASKAARIVLAAKGRSVSEFGTRRTHHEAAITAARSAYLVGFDGTSNVEASYRFSIPVVGTMSHMWVMAHSSELEAFKKFRQVYDSPTLLIDTYDVFEGAKTATLIEGVKAVRIDSGNLAVTSRLVRDILDSRGMSDVKIMASSDLDEYAILGMLDADAQIDMFGVGTKLVNPDDCTSLGIVYKAVYDETSKRPLMKKSGGGKATMPGRKQVFLDQRNGGWGHLIALDGAVESSSDLSPLLDCHIRRGRLVDDVVVSLDVARSYCYSCLTSLNALPIECDLSSITTCESGTVSIVEPHDSLEDMYRKASEI
jgi:nicotinate phosphoribosyltransferase